MIIIRYVDLRYYVIVPSTCNNTPHIFFFSPPTDDWHGFAGLCAELNDDDDELDETCYSYLDLSMQL